jgi:hypothetical protein
MHLFVQQQNTRNALLSAITSAAMNTAVTVSRSMDYITSFDIRLEKDVYYGGESIVGCVVLENSDAIKIRGIVI